MMRPRVPALDHEPCRRLPDVEAPGHVDVEVRLPLRVRHLEERRRVDDAGVPDRHVERVDCGERVVDRGAVGDVQRAVCARSGWPPPPRFARRRRAGPRPGRASSRARRVVPARPPSHVPMSPAAPVTATPRPVEVSGCFVARWRRRRRRGPGLGAPVLRRLWLQRRTVRSSSRVSARSSTDSPARFSQSSLPVGLVDATIAIPTTVQMITISGL